MRAAANVGLKIAVSAGFLWYLLSKADLEGFGDAFAATDIGLFAVAVLLFALSNALGAVQWHLLLRGQTLKISFRQSLVFYWIGVFFNNVLLGNIGGDALRIYDVKRLTGDGSAGAAATFVDRFIGLFSTCTLALIAYVCVCQVRDSQLVTALFPVWLGLVLLLAMGLSRRAGTFLEDRLIVPLLPAFIAELVSRLRRSIVLYRHRVPLLVCAWAVSLGVQLCRILVYWTAGLAVGLQVKVVFFVAFQPVAAVIAALPISIGGLGVRENIMVELFSSIGSVESAALAMSLLGYAAGIIASLLGGIAFVMRRVERTASHHP